VLTRFLEDGRVCLTNNAAERTLRGSFLKQTIEKSHRPKTHPAHLNVAEEITPKIWKDYWSAGQGGGAITEIVSVRALCEQLTAPLFR
jgi:Transposase IS66 family